MLAITNMRDPRCSIIFCYHITKPNILFLRYTSNIIYSANYIPITFKDIYKKGIHTMKNTHNRGYTQNER